ncbi:BEACH domain-containing protein B isoform X3 [Magnolia sinica]|uniref:BEACH domain-containing protein B isoform X3 n=1 Tax=Magnolia sinica TaxID=86752 RepID=UPI002658F04A|nr:BEACH domain-containing protein B isoform X3 [Magnolia sinica]
MNIVKGVADLIRRTSGGHPGEAASWQQAERYSVPSPRIRFRETGDEAVLNTLWERYTNAVDKEEKRKLFQVFLMHFLRVYKKWEPEYTVQLAEAASSSVDHASGSGDILVGCSVGHPAEIILVLTQEVQRMTAVVADAQSVPDLAGSSMTLNIGAEGLHVLDALTIITRSMHNCRVFSYYGGMQKLTALMKAAVVQLKSVIGAFATDEHLSHPSIEKTRVLQKILLGVVSIISSFIDLNANMHEKSQLCCNIGDCPVPKDSASTVDRSSGLKGSISEARFRWQQKAIVSVLEAGGLNWLVELLRVIRRLSLKEQRTEISLQYLTLNTLRSALSENPRAQNHFRSIGGLEVLLDGLSLSSTNTLASTNTFYTDDERCENPIFDIFQLQILSLEVLREAVFGNLNNLQFICEIGRVHKFANNICWPAFMLQELQRQRVESPVGVDFPMVILDSRREISQSSSSSLHQACGSSNSLNWNEYAVKLSSVLCSFLLALEDIEFHCGQASVGRSGTQVSFVYWELSIKWVMKVLLTLFPCIKACSNQTELPSHLRILAYTLQHYILYAFRKVLVSSPTLLEVFREQGIWDLIFSENFFYFGSALEEISGDISISSDGFPQNFELCSNSSKVQANPSEIEILQMEVISFVEFAATLNGNAHNLPECSALLDALEQSACNPEIASVLAKSLQRILQLAGEQTLASFRTLDASARVLKVACIQAQELRRLVNLSPPAESEFHEGVLPKYWQISTSAKTANIWIKCMEDSLELFTEYLVIADDARGLVLHNSKCIDCLFDLFWEKGLRKHVLEHVLGLMKLPPCSEEDQIAKLQLCSKYLETFTRAKERENSFAELSIDLLVGMRDLLLIDQMYYQALFRDGECFLHIVSLLNGSLDERTGEQLVLNVLQTLTFLLTGNDASKAAFRSLVGVGYQTLQSLLLDFCQWRPGLGLLDALLDMLVDGKFDTRSIPVIKNEDVIILFLSVLQKSSDSLWHYGLDVFLQLLKDSITNRASCVRAGMLGFLLDWFSLEDDYDMIFKIAQLIQVIGGYSISGTDIRKIFALLRSEKIGSCQKYCSLLLTSIQSMLKEKGPTAFFELNGNDSGIIIKTPVQWPYNRGISFSCWVRVENFPETGMMGLFSFLTENGKGCSAMLGKGKLVVESINQKRQIVSLDLNLVQKKWHFLCITHSIGRAFSGGSLLRCFMDGDLVSSEKFRYVKVNDVLTRCSIGAKVVPPPNEEDNSLFPMKDTFPFLGQIGPVYMFGDAISSEQIRGIYSLGPSYMYSFLDNDITLASDGPLPNGILDAKDGLASKIIFGLNAQASDGRTLFNVSPMLDHTLDKNLFKAVVIDGTQLCSRRLLQHIIYCVGGVSVFFPLLTQFDKSEEPESGHLEYTLLRSITRDRLATEVIELIASVLDENIANQQQMHLLSGFSILGFLLQSVPPQQLNLEILSALKRMLNVVGNCGMSELVKDAISRIYLNPHIWVYADYTVQRELYMFLIQHFESDPRMLATLCCLPRVIDIIRQFYWDKLTGRSAFGSKPLLHPVTRQVIGERPGQEELHKIRLLLLSLAEMSLRQTIAASDIKALVAFFERSQDMACIEDILHMVLRAISQKPLLMSFLEQVNLLGGCHIFINLLRREMEPIRLLGLQFLGKLLVGVPSEKKGPRFFNLAVGRPKSLSESQRKVHTRFQSIFSAISDRLFMFPQTDILCATLFDVLLGGASPKQVLQKHSQPEKQRNKRNGSSGFSSHFFLPQTLVLIFKILSSCEDMRTRGKILRDLLDLIDSNPSNTEALMENGWISWLETSVRLDVFKNYKADSQVQADGSMKNEQNLVRRIFSSVLSHYICSVKGGWQQLEETVNFLLLDSEQADHSHQHLLRDIFEDLIERLVALSSEENIFVSQPCRDNTLYLLRLVDEILISERGHKLPFLEGSFPSGISPDHLELESHKDISSASVEAVQGEVEGQLIRYPQGFKQPFSDEDVMEDGWWSLYDKMWVLISEMNDKGPSKIFPKASTTGGPSFGQRARGLVESLNIPAAEMAAVVVSGGIGNALGGKSNKYVDKAMLLRGEKCPRIVFRLVILYLCESGLERASRCVQHFISLLPCLLTADDEQSKSRLQLFIWCLLIVRSQYGMLDDGARFHVISHLIRETVNCGKSMLATSILGRDDSSDSSNNIKEAGSIDNLIQKDRVLVAVVDEAKYIKTSKADRTKQLQELRFRIDEAASAELTQKKAFEDEIQASLIAILSSDDSRRVVSQLAYDEDQQIVAEKWVHMFRALIDERGPWSANPFPNSTVTHWKLDKTEDRWRRRLKLKRNYHFDEQLCLPPATASCNDTSHIINEGHFPEKMKRFLLKGIRGITEEGTSEPCETETESSGQAVAIHSDSSDNQCSEYVKDSMDQKDIVQDIKDPSSSTTDTETSEVLLFIPCVLVTPKRKLAGHLAVKPNILHFFGEFFVEGTGGSSVFNRFHVLCNPDTTKSQKGVMNFDVDFEKGNTIDSIGTSSDTMLQNQPNKMKRHRRWHVCKIKAVHWTRYLLRYTAIEIFFNDSVAPVFLNFASQKDAKDVGTLIVSSRNELLFPKGSAKDRNGVISFIDRRIAQEMAEIARDSWRRRDISNFEYLMILNTLAGRSYNDLTQYPVFPWVLADYSSEKLDFNKSSTFRDLSKPVGALDLKRFEVFEDRYRNFCDPDIPSFYYGSHYSSMGIVLYYLLRLEPFTALHRNLQVS